MESTETISDVLGRVRSKGVKLWVENGQLRYKAPRGTLSEDEITRLRVSKVQIVEFLEKASDLAYAEPTLEPRTQRDRAPVAYSQLAHWNLYGLSERPSFRQVVSVQRLLGRLNVELLRTALVAIVQRHEALRTRIVYSCASLTQEIASSVNCELEVYDLGELSEDDRETEMARLIEEHILQPVDLGVDPLFGLRLLRLGEKEHVLIVAMEHMISDEFSVRVLLRDLFTCYTQLSRGSQLDLPKLPVQFADYAVWRRKSISSWLQRHTAYWNEHLAGCGRLRFPEDRSFPVSTRLGWGSVRFTIGRELKTELSDWCRLNRTTLVMSVFTAYVGLVLRWCSASDAVIEYQSDGRISPAIENTIGYFAAVLYIRIRICASETFTELLDQVTAEYCRAFEHADFSYLEAQQPRPEFARNTCFNWVPRGAPLNLSQLEGSEDTITHSPVRFVFPMHNFERDNEPVVLLYDGDTEILGDIYFPKSRFSVESVERFGRNFLVFIRGLLSQSSAPIKNVALCD